MKNYPLLTVNNKYRFYNWRNNYIRPLLNQVKDLSYYSYFIEPPYREIENILNFDSTKKYFKDDKVLYINKTYQCITNNSQGISGSWNSDDWKEIECDEIIINQGNNFNFQDMPVHSYIQLTAQSKVGDITLPSGTWVVSEARNEGINDLKSDFNNYIYMPGGYGSFYVINDIYYDNNKDKMIILFTYLRNAGEIYGYSPKSNFIFNTNRFVLKPTSSPLLLEQKGKTVHSADLGTLLNDNSFTEWYTLGTPMHFFFNGNGEEVILDETHVINLEQANTHSYTINSKHNDVSIFYVDFI